MRGAVELECRWGEEGRELMSSCAPLLSALAVALALAGCAQQPLDVPSDPRARNTGAFPTFAATPAAATRQLPQAQVNSTVRRLEGAEADALAEPRPMMVEERIARLDAAGRRARNAAPIPTDDTARLRRLGRNHVDETIARIEDR